MAKSNKKDFTPAPEGLHLAVCCDVVDLGDVQSQWGIAHKVQIRWQLEEKDPKTEKPYMVVNRYTLSLHEKSRLRPMLEAWRGRKFSTEELEGFDLEKLIGVNCQVQVIHDIKADGEVYANVQAVVPFPAKVARFRVSEDYVRMIDRAERKQLEQSESEDFRASNEDVPF